MSIQAYELLNVISRIQNPAGNQDQYSVQSFECCGQTAFLGTDKGSIHQYAIQKSSQMGYKQKQFSPLITRQLTPRKPVSNIKALPVLNILLIQVDGHIEVLDIETLKTVSMGGQSIRNINSFSLNNNSLGDDAFTVEVCVCSRKKQLHIFSVSADRILRTKEIILDSPPLKAAMSGQYICCACSHGYVMVDLGGSGSRATTVELFPLDTGSVSPIVQVVSKSEFMVAGPGGLAMFTSGPTGASQRPPLQWHESTFSAVAARNYVLALSPRTLTVHSLSDQLQKQRIEFPGGLNLCECDGEVFVCFASEVYWLRHVPWMQQVQSLMQAGNVTEALQLAETSHATDVTPEEYDVLMSQLLQQAGFIKFANEDFQEAAEYLNAGQVDIRKMVGLYPVGVKIVGSEWAAGRGSDSDSRNFVEKSVQSVESLCGGSREKMARYREFLRDFLFSQRLSTAHKKVVYLCLVALCTQLSRAGEVATLAEEIRTDPDLAAALGKMAAREEDVWVGHHHCRALALAAGGQDSAALNIWTRLCDDEITDEDFPGLQQVIDHLTRVSDADLVWKYVDWAMKKDESVAVEIFTRRRRREVVEERFRADYVLAHLTSRNYLTALRLYLEVLVLGNHLHKPLDRETDHTYLATVYLDCILKLRKECPSEDTESKLDEARRKFQSFLRQSSLYRVRGLLPRVQQNGLWHEAAILHGKLGDNATALSILVHKIKSFETASEFCLHQAQADPKQGQLIYTSLLKVYLDGVKAGDNTLIGPAISLLNSPESNFDAVQVLSYIPDNWTILVLNKFLRSALENSITNSRSTRVARYLAKFLMLESSAIKVSTSRTRVNLADASQCAVCRGPFFEASFVRCPKGEVVHRDCMRHGLDRCPLSGTPLRDLI